MLQLPSERIWPSQLVQRHSAVSWRHDSLAASTIEAGYHPRSATMSAATKYAPQQRKPPPQLSVALWPRASAAERVAPWRRQVALLILRWIAQKGCFFNK